MDGAEVVDHLEDDVFEFGIFVTSEEFAAKRHEKGNLELDFVGIGAIENAVEFSVIKGSVEIGGILGFLGGGGVFGGEGVFVGRVVFEVV